jgi:hypothetical protein
MSDNAVRFPRAEWHGEGWIVEAERRDKPICPKFGIVSMLRRSFRGAAHQGHLVTCGTRRRGQWDVNPASPRTLQDFASGSTG